jgi:hypothetical protein
MTAPGVLKVLWVTALLASGCIACRPPRRLPPPPAASAAALSTEDLPATTRVELAIAELSEIASDDKVEVVVSGLVVNRGTRPTTSVLVRVRGIDREGLTVREATVTPSTEHIPSEGGSARFSVVFPNDSAIVDYHIEAIGYGRKVVE